MSNRTCKIDGCTNKKYARNWCKKHYVRWQRHGDPNVQIKFRSPEKSFAARTEWRGDCLIWTGTKNDNGYGQIQVDGRHYKAHRYAWERVNGPVPEGLFVDHKNHCDKACCNIEHLRLATQAQNNSNKSGAQSNSSSGVRNVSWDKERKKWKVQVSKKGLGRYIRRFSDYEEAVTTAEQVRKDFFGEFAGRG